MVGLIFDIETNGLLDTTDVFHCLVTKDIDNKEVRCYHEDPTISPRDGDILCGIDTLLSADILIGHNIIGFDTPAIDKLTGHILYDWHNVDTKCRDTLLMSRLLWPDIAARQMDLGFPRKRERNKKGQLVPILGYSLKAFGKRLNNHKDVNEQWEVFDQHMLDYCVQDVEVTHQLWCCINDPAYNHDEPYNEQSMSLEHQFAFLMHKQQEHGFPVNKNGLLKLADELEAKLDATYDKLKDLVPPTEIIGKKPQYYCHPEYPGLRWSTKQQALQYLRDNKTERTLKVRTEEIHAGPPKTTYIPWNPGSRVQVIKYLTSEFEWVPTVYGKTVNERSRRAEAYNDKQRQALIADGYNPVIDEKVLGSLTYPSVQPLAEFYMLRKRLSQLATGKGALLKYVGDDDRIHGGMNTAGTSTGRATHQSPNMSQVPSGRKPYGEEFRENFITLPGYSMLGFDAAALELREQAHYMAIWDGGEYASLVDADGFDIHSDNQMKFDVPTRDNAKTAYYALIFGAGDGKLGSIVGGGPSDGKRLKATYFTAMPAMKTLIDKCTEKAEHLGYVKTHDGRHINIRSSHSALNSLLQGSGATYMKQAIVCFASKCIEAGLTWYGITGVKHGYDMVSLCQSHDDLLLMVKKEKLALAESLVSMAFDEANTIFGMRCPNRSDTQTGANWLECH